MVSSVDVVKCAGVGCLTYAFLYKRHVLVDIFNNAIIYSMYNIMYAISYVQIKISQIKNTLKNNEMINRLFEPKDFDTHSKIELIKDGFADSTILLHTESNILNNPIFTTSPYDFLLFSYKEDDAVTYKKILKEFKTEDDLLLELSTMKFILMEIFIKDTIIKIELSNDEYNYYIVNNVLDKHVINYIVNEHYFNEKKLILDETFEYELKIIDNNANANLITSDKSIKILKDGYEII